MIRQCRSLLTPIFYSNDSPMQTSFYLNDSPLQTSFYPSDNPMQTSIYPNDTPMQTSVYSNDTPMCTSSYTTNSNPKHHPLFPSSLTIPQQWVSVILTRLALSRLPSWWTGGRVPSHTAPCVCLSRSGVCGGMERDEHHGGKERRIFFAIFCMLWDGGTGDSSKDGETGIDKHHISPVHSRRDPLPQLEQSLLLHDAHACPRQPSVWHLWRDTNR